MSNKRLEGSTTSAIGIQAVSFASGGKLSDLISIVFVIGQDRTGCHL